jgi:uncharacterized protein HemX
LVAQPSFPSSALSVLTFVGIGATETSIAVSVALIAAFALGAVLVSVAHFRWADIAKKIS